MFCTLKVEISFVWLIFWNILVYDTPLTHPRINPIEKDYIVSTIGPSVYGNTAKVFAKLRCCPSLKRFNRWIKRYVFKSRKYYPWGYPHDVLIRFILSTGAKFRISYLFVYLFNIVKYHILGKFVSKEISLKNEGD